MLQDEFTVSVQMVILRCFSKTDDPTSVGGILHSGSYQDNKEFLLSLFDPNQLAILGILEPPAFQFARLIDDKISPPIALPDCVLRHFNKMFKRVLKRGSDPSLKSHLRA